MTKTPRKRKKQSTYRSVFRLLLSHGIRPEAFEGSEDDPRVKLKLSRAQAGKIVAAVQARRKSLGYAYDTNTGEMTIWRLSEKIT
jgi:hypothetical protein